MHIALRILLALLGFVACLLMFGATAQWATSSLPTMVSLTVTGLAVSAGTFGLVFLLRRYVDRDAWKGAMSFDRTTLPLLLLGVVTAAAVAAIGAAITVRLGFADWGLDAATMAKLAELGLPNVIVVTIATTLLVQGFPEELVFRGYMFGNLRARLPLWSAVTVSSLIFGSIHVVSNGGATTLGERLVYAVMATGFGLMLAACRTVSGTLWLGIGFHAGHNAFVRMFVTVRPDAFTEALLVTFGTLVVAAAITFAAQRKVRGDAGMPGATTAINQMTWSHEAPTGGSTPSTRYRST